MKKNKKPAVPTQKQTAKTQGKVAKPPAKQTAAQPISIDESLQNFFAAYADKQENKVTVAGLTQLCQSLNIDIMSDLAVLVIM